MSECEGCSDDGKCTRGGCPACCFCERTLKETEVNTFAEKYNGILKACVEAIRIRANWLLQHGYELSAFDQVRHVAYWLESTEGRETVRKIQEQKEGVEGRGPVRNSPSPPKGG